MASSAAQASPAGRSPALVDLPREVQGEILRHCTTRDLIGLSLVSKHFRELAAAELYREFRILFSDEDNPQFESPADALAGRFDTLVTSDYNYAQHLRRICLDTLYMGDKAQVAYRPYLASLSCGKFMNTLLLLTLRKARALESFKWNIRVELSRPVYQELHQIAALSHVHIRLQAGPSQYETPQPLPYNPSQNPTPSFMAAHVAPTLPPLQPAFMAPQSTAHPGFYIGTASPLPHPLPKPPPARAPRKAPLAKEPPTLSGFKKLRSLAVLDIETLDLIPELQACIRNSAGTLSKLKLSFSEKLASQARKPSVDPEPEDSEAEEEFPPLPVSSSAAQDDDMSGPARAFRAQEERRKQESVLGRIFDVETSPGRPPGRKPSQKDKDVESKADSRAKSDEDFVHLMKTLGVKVMGELHGTDGVTASQEVLDMIGLAAQKYVEEIKSRKGKQQDDRDDTAASSSTANQPSADAATEKTAGPSGAAAASSAKQRDMDPDDIDIEEPEEELSVEPEDPPASDVAVNEPTPAASSSSAMADSLCTTKAEDGKAWASSAAQKANYKAFAEELKMFESQAMVLGREIQRWCDNNTSIDLGDLAEAESQLLRFSRSLEGMQKEIAGCEAEINNAKEFLPNATDSDRLEAHSGRMRQYLQETRGISLQSLSVYLIPVKASVLSRAIDLRSLRRLTLLNVGVQAPIWTLLNKENKEAPLPLRKIFTDNVSLVFLNFVAGLDEVEELFMLEREAKAKPESFAPRTHIDIEAIRRMVLKRHMPTLRRLMVKKLSDDTWDLDEKTVFLLCRQGRKLEELACNMGIPAIHAFIRHMGGLTALRALHVVELRNDDTCVWVMRETKFFLIDTVSHCPALRKLEWVSVDEEDRVSRLVRPAAKKKKKGGDGDGDDDDDDDNGGKGKGKAKEGQQQDKSGKAKAKASKGNKSKTATAIGGVVTLDIPALIAAELADDFSSDEEDAAAEAEFLLGQKIEVVDGMHFCDVDDVRIFKKEVVAGRL